MSNGIPYNMLIEAISDSELGEPEKAVVAFKALIINSSSPDVSRNVSFLMAVFMHTVALEGREEEWLDEVAQSAKDVFNKLENSDDWAILDDMFMDGISRSTVQ